MYFVFYLFIGVCNFFNYLIYKYKKLIISDKFYAVGGLIFSISMLFINYKYINIIFSISIVLIEIGFLTWVFNFYKKYIKDVAVYKTIYWLLNFFILWLSNIISQYLVEKALGLPPKDFDLTLYFWTLICYVPAWLYLVTFIFFIIYILVGLGWIIKIFSEIFLDMFKPFLKIFIIKEAVEDNAKKGKSISQPFHFIGLFITLITFYHVGLSISRNEVLIYPIVKNIAYYTDYKELSKYPGSEKNQKIILHANNVVSIAKKNGDKVEISVKKIE
ncbi:hypothetical protein [Acinetobacter calcoaceticus]